MANIKALYGKYLVTLEYPATLQELIWRVAYMRRNRESWRLLTDSFKPSTTNYQTDISIKNATFAQIDKLEAFYESAATIDPYNPALSGEKFLLRLKKAVNPVPSSTGINTNLSNATQAQYARIQAANPVSVPVTGADASAAAENIPQDIERIREGVVAVFNSYGSPYTETRGETCTRWVFNSRNLAFKAIALMTQEYPWLMQVVNNFDIFTNDVVSTIGKLNRVNGSVPQLYGHIESPSNETVSPRHLLTPLWSASANIPANIPTRTSDGTISPILDASGVVKQLGGLAKKGAFTIRHVTKNADGTDKLGTAQDLIKIYCEDTYEQNAWFTNKALQVTPRT